MTVSSHQHPDKKPAMSNTILRIVTAVAFIPVIYAVFSGGMLAAVICLVFGALMAYEAIRIAGMTLITPIGIVYFIMIMLPAVMVIMPAAFQPAAPPSYLLGMGIVGLAFLAKDITTKLVMVSLCACVFSLLSIVLMDGGIDWLILAVVSVIAADSAAYFGGRRIGGPKLAPFISPSKTWSGALCGVTAGGIAGYGVGMVIGFTPSLGALAGLVIADLSIGGDLLESWFKRRHGVKDSGSILPGHGGFLDRFDGYLIVLPILYVAIINGLSGYGG